MNPTVLNTFVWKERVFMECKDGSTNDGKAKFNKKIMTNMINAVRPPHRVYLSTWLRGV